MIMFLKCKNDPNRCVNRSVLDANIRDSLMKALQGLVPYSKEGLTLEEISKANFIWYNFASAQFTIVYHDNKVENYNPHSNPPERW